MPVDPVRDTAIDVLLRVFERGIYLDRALDRSLRKKQLADRGRRFLTQLVYGTVRHRRLADHVLEGLCRQPLADLPAPILAIMRMAVFQALFCNQVTRPAMVHTSVDLAKRRGHAGLGRLTNAVLRKTPETLDEVKFPDRGRGPEEFLGVRYSAPPWLVALCIEELGTDGAEAYLDASCGEAPLSLRVNTLKTSPAELVERLGRSGMTAAGQTGLPEELTLLSGPSPLRTKWFQGGHFIIQDPASMIPPHLLEPQPGERVLDLCAAPGGKATHLAQLTVGEAPVVAADRNQFRLASVADNAERLGLSGIRAVCADGSSPPFGPVFDRVLLDAPCSGLGTLRRHPDIKWRMKPESIARLACTQGALLRSALRLVKPGGVAVYSVCTFTRQETVEPVQAALEAGGVDLEDGPEYLDQWKIDKGQYRTSPSGEALDGFFLTRFRKQS